MGSMFSFLVPCTRLSPDYHTNKHIVKTYRGERWVRRKGHRSLTNLPNNVETVFSPVECYRVLEREKLQTNKMPRQLSR
jgi:hypothetical protein